MNTRMNPFLEYLRCACMAIMLAALAPAWADNIDDRIVDLNATASSTAPRITLTWTHRLPGSTTGYSVFRRLKGEEFWTKLADLAKTETTYADAAADAQIHYEYKVERKHSTTTPSIAYGYVCSGVDIPAVENRGKLILLVDNTMTAPLATEIAQLQQDLTGDGWTVLRHDVPRMATSPATTGTAVGPARLAELEALKAVIQSDYNADPAKVTAVYLLGRLPVPYSGNVNPDGHSNHRGAWPADVYYGDMNGTTWTDATVDNSATTLTDVRNRNIPGDGKFDQSNTSGTVLQVGRVDLSNMTLFPNTGTSETELLRRYLNRAHAFRHRQGNFETISRQAFIDYNFGYNYVTFWYVGFAWQGWMTGYSWFGRGNLVQGSWFLTSSNYNTVNQSYLFGYADGGGGFQGHLDLGTTPVSGATHLTLSYTRPAPAPIGVTYVVETSGDLAAWSPGGTVEIGSTDNGNGTRTITVRDGTSSPPAANRFIRLKISTVP